MALEIQGSKITLTRGDSLRIYISLKYKNTKTQYIPEEGDQIRFALKKKYSDIEPLILKQIPTDTLLLHLTHEDTESLNVGSYVYDIELTHANGDVDTFIDKAIFAITEEVY